MFYALLFFLELFALFLLSTVLTKTLSSFLYRITKSEKVTIHTIAFLFFPGTVIHELAHAIMARLLFVGVGHMEFIPQLHGDTVKLGSVAIHKTDIFRRLLIGMAPFLLGTIVVLGTIFLTLQYNLIENPFILLLVGYVIFEIGNTMFSSRKDMEGALELLVTLLVLFVISYLLGFRIEAFNPEPLLAQPLVQ